MKIFLFFFTSLFFLTNVSYGSHIAGGNISYTCTGNPNEYEVSLTLYRDCSGISAPTSASITFANSCGLANPTLALTLAAILPGETAEVSQLCPTSLGQSTCNGGTLPGVEQYVYTGIVTFPDVCDSWTMSYNICDRNPTDNLSGTNCFNIVSTLNSATAPCNTSPTVVTNYPIPYVCNGQQVSHDFGVVEPDGNDLQFSFTNALTTGSTDVTYNAGYTAAEPIPGITIDPNTGQVSFLPGMNGNFVVAVLIEEFDGAGNLVGSMIHDIQFVVQTCTNNGVVTPNGTTNFNNNGTNAALTATNVISMCDGDSFCVDFEFSDPDMDELFLGTNALDILPGATFTQTGTNPAIGTLCWTYTDGYTGNLISITASDSVCPTPSNVSYILNLDIPPPLNASLNDTICGDQFSDLQAFGTAPVTWTVLAGEPINVGTNFTCNPCTTPTATPSITTTYEVTEGSVCQLTEQITVTVVQNQGGIDANIITNDTTLCAGECFDINAIAEEEFSGVNEVSFTDNTVMAINSNTTITSTINVAGLNMTNMSVGSIESVCMNLDHTWDSDLDIYLICPDGTQFMLTTDNGGSGNNYNNTCFTLDAVTQINSGSAPFTGDFIPEGGVLSGAMVGCTANGIWGLEITDDAGGDVGTLFDWGITFNDDIPSGGPATAVNWTSTSGAAAGIDDPTSATSQICPTADSEYILYAYNVDNCWDSDTLVVSMGAAGDPGLDSVINICVEAPQIDLFTYLGGTPDATGQWFDAAGNVVSPLMIPNTITSGSVYEYEVGVAGCLASAFVTVNIIEVTATSVIDDSDCQACNGSIQLTPTGGLGEYQYSVDNGANFQTTDLFSNLCGGVGTDYDVLIVDSIGCQVALTETVVDDNFPQIDNVISTDSECGLNDGEVSVTTASSGGTAPYLYSVEGSGNPFQVLPIIDLAPSQPTYNLIVEDNNGCTDTVAFTVNEINSPVITATNVTDNVCFGVCEGEIEIVGTNVSHYSIDGGVNVQTSNVFTGVCAGSYDVIAYSSDPATTTACSVTTTNITVIEPAELSVVLTPSPSVTICPGDEVLLVAEGAGGNGNYSFNWTDGLNALGTGTSLTVNPSVNTQVFVSITEADALNPGGVCPQSDIADMQINMPMPIYPALTSDITEGCYPITVDFTNLSNNPAEIQSTNWSFSSSYSADALGASNISAAFDEVGLFDVTMTVTSIYGCVYDTTYTEYIETFGYPDANFTYTPIPPTIYDTEVSLTNLSSDDVVQNSWVITGGNPASSSNENEVVYFPEGVAGVYPVVLTVWNEHGCVDSIVSQVEVINDVICYAPNIFTPDGDEFNETWRVYINGIDIYDYHATIFNRWGEIVWESYDSSSEWDGTYGSTGKVQDGTYVWVVYAKDSYNDKKYEFRGTVSILE